MRPTSPVSNSVREKLQDLRQAAKSLKFDVRGPQSERTAAKLKDFKKWADLREKATDQGTR